MMHLRMHKKNSTCYRLPAEWEPHKATWLTWPHNPTDWPGKMSSVQKTYAELTQKIAAVEDEWYQGSRRQAAIRVLIGSE